MAKDELMIDNENIEMMPAIALRDVVVFPGSVVPLFMGRKKSIAAAEAAMKNKDKRVLLVTQKDPNTEEPKRADLYPEGCVANILQMIHLPDGTVKALVEGVERYRLEAIRASRFYLSVKTKKVDSIAGSETEQTALRRLVSANFGRFANEQKKLPPEAITALEAEKDFVRYLDQVTAVLPSPVASKVAVLGEENLIARYQRVLELINLELEIQQVDKRIHGRVKQRLEKSQRDYYLNEQIRAIQKELGEGEEDELNDLEDKIKAAKMSKEATDKALSELKKLRQMQPMSAEATVVRSYIETVLGLPWTKKSKVSSDIQEAAKVLDEDHWGLEKIKERILEYLAVQKRVDKLKSPILCFVGAPGVGKTSLGRSIARATGREYVRMALGGIHDESEIRGHRRTYIGSMPGKILQNLSKVGVRNPLFLLDEVDKLGSDHRGDPAAALLEVLDPEQNNTFQDHYVDVDFDLSDVMFVATSNSYNIPPALLDRMEVISLSGYTEDEKVHIAQKHLIPKQQRANGVKETEVQIKEEVLRDIIRYYTREAGVRGLEREISKILRKVVRQILTSTELALPVVVNSQNLDDYLGVRRMNYGSAGKEPQVGQVNGLAWTEVGGDMLSIEAAVFPGKGVVQRTGSLGDVMKESVEAARSVVRARSKELYLDPEVFNKTDWHLHFPEGATPKDGPSAGGAITTAMVSALTNIPVKANVAMTGEITLHGKILEIGGLKEKLLAAMRGGIETVMIPKDNEKDLVEIPDNVKEALTIIPVETIEDILPVALVRMPVQAPDTVAN